MTEPTGSFAERPVELADAPLLAKLLNDAVRPYLGRDVMPVEVLDSILRLPTLDLARDCRVLLAGDRPVASAIVSAHEPFDSARVFVAVPPQPGRRAVAGAALTSAVALARRRADLSHRTQLLPEVPADDAELRSVLEAQGFVHRYSSCEMHRDLRDLAEPSWPTDVRVTAMPTDVASLTLIGEANREAFTDHDGDHAMPVADFVHMVRTTPSWRPDQSVVAWRGDRPVGLALNGVEELGDGETSGYVGSLAVRREARGQGLGRALLLASFERLAAAGLGHVMLHVQLGNRSGADRLYRSVGMTPGPQEQTWGRALGHGATAAHDDPADHT